MSSFLDKTGLTLVRSAINTIYTRKDSISNKGATLTNGSAVTVASIGGKNITVTLPKDPLCKRSVANGNKNNYKYHRIASCGSKASPITSSYQDFDAIIHIRQTYDNGKYGIIKLSLRKNDTTTVSNAYAKWIVNTGFKTDAIKIGLVDSATSTYADVFFEAPGTYIRVETVFIQGPSSFNLYSTKEVDNTTTSSKLTSSEVYLTIESACEEIHGTGSTYTKIVNSTLSDVYQGNTFVSSLKSSGRVYGTYMIAEGSGPYMQLQNSADIDGDNKYNPRIMSYSHTNSNDGAMIDIGMYRNGYDYRTLRIKSLDSDTNVISLCEMRGGSADNHTFESFELWGRHNTVPIANGGTGQKSRADAMNALFSLGGNVISSTTNDTTAKWGALGPGYSFYSVANQLTDQPQQYGFVLNIPSGKSAEVFQLWRSQPNGALFHRGGNNDNWSGSWRQCLDNSNYTTWLVPKTGGTFTGAVTVPSLTLNGDITYTNGDYTNYPMIKFKTGNNNGAGILIGGGGYVGIGSGESANAVFDAISATGDAESTHISSDGAINFYTNCQTIANRVTTTLDSTGNLTAISFTATSDARLKTNIKDYTPNASILDLPIKEFDYIKTGKHSIGCIAQDLQNLFPELVHKGNDGYLSVNEDKIIYLLLHELKKQNKRIEELERH